MCSVSRSGEVVVSEAQARRLCLFLPSLKGGGAERVMVTLANGFAARGREVIMVLGEGAGPFRDDVTPEVEIVDLSRRHVTLALPGLAAVLRRRRADALLSAVFRRRLFGVAFAPSSCVGSSTSGRLPTNS